MFDLNRNKIRLWLLAIHSLLNYNLTTEHFPLSGPYGIPYTRASAACDPQPMGSALGLGF